MPEDNQRGNKSSSASSAFGIIKDAGEAINERFRGYAGIFILFLAAWNFDVVSLYIVGEERTKVVLDYIENLSLTWAIGLPIVFSLIYIFGYPEIKEFFDGILDGRDIAHRRGSVARKVDDAQVRAEETAALMNLAATQRHSELEQSTREKEHEISTLQAEEEKLTSQIEASNRDIAKKQTELEQLKGENETASKEIDQLRYSEKELRDEVATLRDQVAMLNSEMNKLREEGEALKSRKSLEFDSNRNIKLAAVLEAPINRDSLAEYTKLKFPNMTVDEGIQELLLNDINAKKFRTVADIDDVLSRAEIPVSEYAFDHPELFKSGTDFLTKSLGFIDLEFRKKHGFSQTSRQAFLQYDSSGSGSSS